MTVYLLCSRKRTINLAMISITGIELGGCFTLAAGCWDWGNDFPFHFQHSEHIQTKHLSGLADHAIRLVGWLKHVEFLFSGSAS